jgi:uncharacterized protein YozE (UPF0346 family)
LAPLGYDNDREGRKIVVNEDEAAQVRGTFELYLECQSIIQTIKEIDRRGWTNKLTVTKSGKERGGRHFDKSSLFKLLTNVAYIRPEAGDWRLEFFTPASNLPSPAYLGYAPELIQDVVTSVADKMKGQLKQLEDERLALGRDTARWNSEIRKTTALIRPNETDSPAIARLADLQERIAHNERRINTVLSDIKKISNNLLTQQDVETAMTTFDPIWESMTLRDQIRLVQVAVKQVDYDGESGRVTITFNPIGIKKRAEYATKDLEEARA